MQWRVEGQLKRKWSVNVFDKRAVRLLDEWVLEEVLDRERSMSMHLVKK